MRRATNNTVLPRNTTPYERDSAWLDESWLSINCSVLLAEASAFLSFLWKTEAIKEKKTMATVKKKRGRKRATSRLTVYLAPQPSLA